MISLDDELATCYLAESREHLIRIESDLLTLESRGAESDAELVHRVFRAVHSIKGGAGFFELAKIGELAHRMEDVLAAIRARAMEPTPARAAVLLRAADRLRDLIHEPAASNQADIAEIMAALASLQAGREDSAGNACHRAAGRADRNGAPLRMLLVEDDFTSRLLMQTFLSRYGECHIAVNGREAVEAFRSALDAGREYDLVCMDIMMPEMDGREAVRQVRALEEARGILSTYGAKIIMTTAVNEVKEVIRCFQELCDAYLIKPIDLGELLLHMKSYRLVE
jgi:two-component system chemotaxis response regulator CheY